MTFSRLKTLGITLLTFLNVYNCSKSNENDLLDKQIKPLIWGSSDFSVKQHLIDFKEGKRAAHPLDIGKALIYTSYRFQQTGNIKYRNLSMGYLKLIKDLYAQAEYFSENTFKYNFAHNNLKPGWWSGMANSAIVYGLTFCDSVYGTDHQAIIDALIKNLKTDYRDGGCLYTIDNNRFWILEYAWPGIDENSVKYVLNGFLYSLVCMKLANEIDPNPDLDLLFDSGMRGLQSKLNDYYFDEVAWTKYDLNPTIEPPHYAIFDIILLESLASIKGNGEEWIQRTISKRRSILKKSYKLDIVKTDENDYSALFSLIGPPNPYWIDIYPIEIEIEYANGEVKSIDSHPPKDFEMDIHKRGFIGFNIDRQKLSEIKNVVFYSKYSGQKQQLFKYSQKDLKKIITEKSNVPHKIKNKPLKANYDGVYKDSMVVIETKRYYKKDRESYKSNIAQIIVPFLEAANFQENESLALKIENSLNIKTHKLFIYSEDGKVFQQYCRPIPNGANVIVVNPIEFEGYDSTIPINRLAWQIYTSELEPEGIIKIDGIFKTKSQKELETIRSTKGSKPSPIRRKAITANYDGVKMDSAIEINTERIHNKNSDSYKNRVAQIVVPFSATRYFQENENLVFKVENDFEIINHKFFLYSGDGEVSQRYYLPIPKGKNILVLNPVGFEEYNSAKGIKKIVWQIYTNNMEQNGVVKIQDIFKTENNFQLRSVFENSEYNFEEKVIRGNIY